MSKIVEAVEGLKETLELYSEDNISEFSDKKIIEYATDHIASLELENSLYSISLSRLLIL